MDFSVFDKFPERSEKFSGAQTAERFSQVGLLPQLSQESFAVQVLGATSVTKSMSGSLRSAPKLALPEVSIIDFIALLREFQRTNSISDVKQAMVNANHISAELAKNQAADIENQALISAQNDAIKEKEKAKKVPNWVLGILGFLLAVAAVVAVVATGGTGAVFVIAAVGAVVGLITASLNVADLIVHEIGCKRQNEFGENVSVSISFAEISNLCQESDVASGKIRVIGFNATSQTPGAITRDEYLKEKSDKAFVTSVVIGAAMLLLALVSIASAIRGSVGLAQTGVKVTETAAETGEVVVNTTAQTAQAASRLQTAATFASAAGTLFTAGTGGYNTYLSFMLAFQSRDLRTSQITEKTLEAAIEALQQQFDKNQQNFRTAMDLQQTLRTLIADSMEAFHQSSMTIAKNCRF